jgi:hypothetical protein
MTQFTLPGLWRWASRLHSLRAKSAVHSGPHICTSLPDASRPPGRAAATLIACSEPCIDCQLKLTPVILLTGRLYRLLITCSRRPLNTPPSLYILSNEHLQFIITKSKFTPPLLSSSLSSHGPRKQSFRFQRRYGTLYPSVLELQHLRFVPESVKR